MSKVYSWVLWPHHEYLLLLKDEFVVNEFRVLLKGNTLHIELEQSGNGETKSQARELAQKYIKLLFRHLQIPLRLVTVEELASMPATMITGRSLKPEEHGRVCEAIRRARGEMLTSGDPTLRRCYDYIQEAQERERESLFYLYKAIKAIERQLRGEEKSIKVLKVGSELKFVKRLANAPAGDQRHPPKTEDAVRRPRHAEKARALDCAVRILRGYERHVTQRSMQNRGLK